MPVRDFSYVSRFAEQQGWRQPTGRGHRSYPLESVIAAVEHPTARYILTGARVQYPASTVLLLDGGSYVGVATRNVQTVIVGTARWQTQDECEAYLRCVWDECTCMSMDDFVQVAGIDPRRLITNAVQA